MANAETIIGPKPDDPNGSPAWQRSQELCAKVNLPRRLERARIANANRDEAIRRGDRDAALIAGHQAREAGQAARRDHHLLYRRAVREGHAQPVGVPSAGLRTARPRGSRRTVASSSDDDGGGEPEPPRALVGKRELRKWWRRRSEELAAFSRGEGA